MRYAVKICGKKVDMIEFQSERLGDVREKLKLEKLHLANV
jgi:hypothetical protein